MIELTVGQTHVILSREVTDHMIRTRDGFLSNHGLSADAPDPSPGNKILRADVHPRLLEGQEDAPWGVNVVSVEMTDVGVVLTAMAPGHATVHVVDEASVPGAVEHDVYVVRAPRPPDGEEA